MSLYMETTKIEVEKTVSQIQMVLGRYGASAIMTEFNEGEVTGVAFQITINNMKIPFRLPCRWESIRDQLSRRRKRARYSAEADKADEDQAKRVAWRQILRWVEAQLALVETDMVKIQEVFLPYVQVGIKGQTLYQQLENKKFSGLVLPGPKE